MLLAPQQLKRAALLHDAAEAYLGDVVSPLKHILKDVYAPMEERMQRAIFTRFNEPIENLALVKEYDLKAYELEKMAYKKGRTTEWMALWNHAGYEHVNWHPDYAKMRMYCELSERFEREVCYA
jgi:hypothetical protein